jgi:hypothetical protein
VLALLGIFAHRLDAGTARSGDQIFDASRTIARAALRASAFRTVF